jgi:hypothetical protein
MELVSLLLGLSLPWMTGSVWVRLTGCGARQGGWTIILGYGYVLGMLGTALIMWLIDTLGAPQEFAVLVTILCLLLAVGLRWARSIPRCDRAPGLRRPLALGRKTLFVLALLLIIARLVDLSLEVFWLPLYPWDAWTTWAVKARVWFELRELVPFVPSSAWLAQPHAPVYSLGVGGGAEKYPPLVPLVEVWMALALGRWDEAWVNIPWLQCVASLGLAFYGQIRAWGSSPVVAISFTYLLLSLPLLDTHVALAGYADLWLASTYALAFMAFLHWLRSGDNGQGLLALFAILAGTQIKLEGAAWALTFLPALGYVALRRAGSAQRWIVLPVAALLLGGGVLVVWYLPWGAILPSGVLVGLSVSDFGQVAHSFVKNLFVFDNWHLFWYVWLGGLLASVSDGKVTRREILSGSVVLAAVGIVLFVFSLTEAAAWATLGTAVNRVILQIVPALLFHMATLFTDRLREADCRAQTGPAAEISPSGQAREC